MKKITTIFFFSAYCCHAAAQGFTIEIPKKIDPFTANFLSVLNESGNNFARFKGKQIPIKDTIHLASNIFQAKIKLPASTNGRVVTDSTLYMEFFFGDFVAMADAFAMYDSVEGHVCYAIGGRSYIKDYHLDTNGTVVRLEKIAYCTNRGFFHFNIALQIIRLLHNGQFRVMLQVYNGRPQFYYRILPHEPIGSFNMVNSLKTNLAALQNDAISGCPTDVPPFKCIGKRVEHDTTFVTYQKFGFDDYMNPRNEYDVYMSNIRAALGSGYVFYSVPCPAEGPVFKRWAFININDLENYKRKTVLLSLVELPTKTLTERGYQKAYAIELDFAY